MPDTPGAVFRHATHRLLAHDMTVATGEPYTARYVAVLTITGGLIRHHRDYWNPLSFAQTRTARDEATTTTEVSA